MEFDDLWKFHAPVNIVEGFDVSLFDKLIEVKNKLSIYFLTRKNGLLCKVSGACIHKTVCCLSGLKAEE